MRVKNTENVGFGRACCPRIHWLEQWGMFDRVGVFEKQGENWSEFTFLRHARSNSDNRCNNNRCSDNILGFDDQALTAITQLDNISSGDLIKGLGNDSIFAIVLRCAGQTYNKSGRMSIINEFLRYRG